MAGSHQALVRGTQQRVHAHARRHGGVARARAAVARPPAAPCWQGGAPGVRPGVVQCCFTVAPLDFKTVDEGMFLHKVAQCAL